MVQKNSGEAFELFLSLRGLPEAEQHKLLENCPAQLREEVRSLLDHDREPHPLVAGFDEPIEWDRAWTPERIGGYAIVGRIGEGASGVVFEGIEPGLSRRVAIKALLPGRLSPSSLRRFEREARVLAILDHPGIARVLRIGTAREGRFAFPYIVMELVHGVPLTQFVLNDRVARLELMARVCDAVQHAHQKGVVHRDLKPSNILVEPSMTPRVLDFGIARLIHGDADDHATLTGDVLGTPPYLSPEQARGDWRHIDTRSDIYSLGVLVLESLTGTRPTTPPNAPLGAALIDVPRSVPGDLRAVILKATAQQPEDRYANASELAADLRRVVRKEPVLARRYNAWRRSISFVRRHKALSTAVAAILIGAGLSAWQAHRASENYRTFRDVLLTFCNELEAPLTDDQRRLALVEQISRLDLGGSREEASVLLNIAKLMHAKGNRPHRVTGELLRRAIAILEKVDGPAHPRTLAARLELAEDSFRWHDYEQAAALARDVCDSVRDDAHSAGLLANAQVLWANSLMRQGHFAEVVPLARTIAAVDGPCRLSGLSHLGEALMRTGRVDEGIVYLRTVDRILRESRTEPVLYIYNLRLLAGYALRREGDVDGARGFLNEAAELAAKLDLSDEDDLSPGMSLAGLWWLLGDFDRCEQVLKDLIARAPRRAVPEATGLLECKNMLGVCLRDQGRFDEAEPLLRAVLEERTSRDEQAGKSATDPAIGNSLFNLAHLLVCAGRPGGAVEAAGLAKRARAVRLAAYPEGSQEVLECDGLLGEALVAQGKIEEGMALFERLLQVRGELANGDWLYDGVIVTYVWSLAKVGRGSEAEALLVRELEHARTELGEHHLVTLRRKMRLNRFRAEHPAGATQQGALLSPQPVATTPSSPQSAPPTPH